MEYVVNNCPLLTISDDINDYNVLISDNFLLGYKSRDINIGDGCKQTKSPIEKMETSTKHS